MSSSKLGLASLLVLALALSSGCRATIPDAWFGCSADSDCPPGQACSAGVCRSGGGLGDAGVPSDGGASDGGGGDAGGGDAGSCDDGLFCNGVETGTPGSCVSGTAPCGGEACDEVLDTCAEPSPVELRFVHASYRLQGSVDFRIEGTESTGLGYGGVSAPITIPGPPDGSVDVFATIGSVEITASLPAHPRMLIVLGPSETGDAGDALYVFPDDLEPSGDALTFRYINMMGSRGPLAASEYTGSTSGEAEIIPLGAAGRFQSAAPGAGGTAVVGANVHEAPGGTVLSAAVAGFFSSLDRSAFVLLYGDLRRHPGDVLGPVMMVLDDDPVGALPDALTGVLNTTDTTLYACIQSASTGGTTLPIDPGQLFDPISLHVSFQLVLSFATTETGACDASAPSVPLATLQPRQRHLVVVSTAGAGLQVHTISEPAWDGTDHQTDTQLAFANYSSRPALELAISDTAYSPILSDVAIGEHYWTWVERSYLQGEVAITDSGAGADRSQYVITAEDTTDALFFVYVDVATTRVVRSVVAPFGGAWLAGTR